MREPVFTETLQIALVVRSLEESLKTYVEEYGIGPWEIYEFNPDTVTNLEKDGQPTDMALGKPGSDAAGHRGDLGGPDDEEARAGLVAPTALDDPQAATHRTRPDRAASRRSSRAWSGEKSRNATEFVNFASVAGAPAGDETAQPSEAGPTPADPTPEAGAALVLLSKPTLSTTPS